MKVYTHYEVDGDTVYFYNGDKDIDSAQVLDIIEDWLETNPNFKWKEKKEA